MILSRISVLANPYDSFKPGDHVRVWRNFYWHHAIYVGNGWLIEFGGSALGGPVAYVTWSDFARDDQVAVVPHTISYARHEIVARAQARLGETGFFALTNNCEHFANWCVSGKSESGQAQLAGLALLGLSAFLLLSPAGQKLLRAA